MPLTLSKVAFCTHALLPILQLYPSCALWSSPTCRESLQAVVTEHCLEQSLRSWNAGSGLDPHKKAYDGLWVEGMISHLVPQVDCNNPFYLHDRELSLLFRFAIEYLQTRARWNGRTWLPSTDSIQYHWLH